MTTPIRLQRSRAKGAKLTSPNGLPVVCVTRPGIFGNPFPWTAAREAGYCGTVLQLKEFSVEIFRQWVMNNKLYGHFNEERLERLLAALPTLRGKNLACWCGPDDPCNADVLLRLANTTTP